MVGDHERYLCVELACVPAPEEVYEAVVVARDQDRRALGPIGVAHAPVDTVLARQGCERPSELVPAQPEALSLHLHSHEEPAAGKWLEVLVYPQDVAVVLLEEGRDRCDQALPIRA